MTDLFGKGGNKAPIQEKDSEPAQLTAQGSRAEILNQLQNPSPEKPIGPSSNNTVKISDSDQIDTDSWKEKKNNVSQNQFKTTGPLIRNRTDNLRDFSDMQETDDLKNEDLVALRTDSYKLSNLEKELGIRHSNDFNNIIKAVLVGFSLLVGLGFAMIIGIIVWTSYKSNKITETGIVNSILDFIIEIVKIGLGT